MEPLSPITLPVRLTAIAIIFVISALVLGPMIYYQSQQDNEDT